MILTNVIYKFVELYIKGNRIMAWLSFLSLYKIWSGLIWMASESCMYLPSLHCMVKPSCHVGNLPRFLKKMSFQVLKYFRLVQSQTQPVIVVGIFFLSYIIFLHIFHWVTGVGFSFQKLHLSVLFAYYTKWEYLAWSWMQQLNSFDLCLVCILDWSYHHR